MMLGLSCLGIAIATVSIVNLGIAMSPMLFSQDGYISIVNLKMDLKKAIQRNAAFSA